jgi:hypothetical protein
MVAILLAPVLLTSSLFALTGCSNRQVYDSLQGAKQNECNKIADNNERQRCFDDAGKSYDRYQRERETAPAK